MDYIRVTRENIDKEHICCAMSGKQSLAKKEWLKQRFEEGLVFYRSAERGKCFIEYIPAENAWVPIDAAGWLYINCLWVSGSMKGHGYSSELLEECLRDAKAQGKNGVCILCAEGRKREFLADPKFLAHKASRFRTSPIAASTSCTCPLQRVPSRQNSRPAPSIPRWRRTVLSFTIPTSAPTPIIGCQRCRRLQRNMESRSKPSTSQRKRRHKMCRTGHNIRIVPGWEVCDPEHPVGQEIFEIGRRSGLNHTTEIIDFLCLSVIPFVTRPTALLSSPMVETPALKEIFRKTQRGDHF